MIVSGLRPLVRVCVPARAVKEKCYIDTAGHISGCSFQLCGLINQCALRLHFSSPSATSALPEKYPGPSGAIQYDIAFHRLPPRSPSREFLCQPVKSVGHVSPSTMHDLSASSLLYSLSLTLTPCWRWSQRSL